VNHGMSHGRRPGSVFLLSDEARLDCEVKVLYYFATSWLSVRCALVKRQARDSHVTLVTTLLTPKRLLLLDSGRAFCDKRDIGVMLPLPTWLVVRHTQKDASWQCPLRTS
jgi:hypothetical protein